MGVIILVNAVFLYMDSSWLISQLDIFERLHVTLQALETPVSISMGTAISHPGSTFNSLYQRADDALYTAKKKGRDRIEF